MTSSATLASGASHVVAHARARGPWCSPSEMSDVVPRPRGQGAARRTWDVHAAKLVDCVGCHYAPNDPARVEARPSDLRYVRADPRRISTAEFLMRPDHRLAEPDCRSCHAPLETHDFLPYAARHMEVLACTACHAPGPMGPAAQMIDATVATLEGTPLVRFRNVERRPGEPLNAATIRPLRPLLVMRADANGARRLTPVNVVSHFRWVSGVDRTEVPFDAVARAWLEGGRIAPAVVQALDSNHDGSLDEAELRLDTPARAAVIAARLRTTGVVDPVIDGALEIHPLAHGIPGRHGALRECAECHEAEGRLAGEYVDRGLPAGRHVTTAARGRSGRPGRHHRPDRAGGAVVRARRHVDPGRHARPRSLASGARPTPSASSSSSRCRWVCSCTERSVSCSRGAFRRQSTGHRPGASPSTSSASTSGYGTGSRPQRASSSSSPASSSTRPRCSWPIGLSTAVACTTARPSCSWRTRSCRSSTTWPRRRFATSSPRRRGSCDASWSTWSSRRAVSSTASRTRRNAPDQKLNPLQQFTYLALLNVLFPLQIVTGLLIWAVGHWPSLGAGLGGLSILAPLHNLGAWLFLTFFVLHVYLVTTGRTLGELLTR